MKTKLTIAPKFSCFELRHKNSIVKQITTIYARLVNEITFRCQTVISARIDKLVESAQLLDETELYMNLKNYHKLTQLDIEKNHNRSHLRRQLYDQEVKNSGGWRFDDLF